MNEMQASLGVVRALWNELIRGSLRIAPGAAGQANQDGQDLRLEPSMPAKWTQGRARRQTCCADVLRGEPQKAVAANMNLAPATLAGLLRLALLDLGIDARCCRVPVALPLLLHASESSRVIALCEVGEGPVSEQIWQLSLSFPDQLLAGVLSEGERAVTARYVAGQTYEEIAQARQVSKRTIANQLSVSFKKLGASGRFSLISALVERGARRGTPITLTVRALPGAPNFGEEEAAPLSTTTFPRRALSA